MPNQSVLPQAYPSNSRGQILGIAQQVCCHKSKSQAANTMCVAWAAKLPSSTYIRVVLRVAANLRGGDAVPPDEHDATSESCSHTSFDTNLPIVSVSPHLLNNNALMQCANNTREALSMFYGEMSDAHAIKAHGSLKALHTMCEAPPEDVVYSPEECEPPPSHITKSLQGT